MKISVLSMANVSTVFLIKLSKLILPLTSLSQFEECTQC